MLEYQDLSEGMKAASKLLETVELNSRWPSQVRFVLTVLLPKKLGFRMIGLFCSLYRLWGRSRRYLAKAWELQHPSQPIAWSSGKGCISAAWGQAARSEVNVLRGGASAAILDRPEAPRWWTRWAPRR